MNSAARGLGAGGTSFYKIKLIAWGSIAVIGFNLIFFFISRSTIIGFMPASTIIKGSPPLTSLRLVHGSEESVDRITFKFNRASPGEGPLRNTSMGMMYRCPTQNDTWPFRTSALPPSLRERGVIDFATAITTDVNTLFVGDSVAQQLSEASDESCGMLDSWTRFNEKTDDPKMTRRRNLWGQGGYKEILSVSTPLRGGGSNAYWRMENLWTERIRGKRPPAGWNENQAKMLLDSLPEEANRTFDVVVLNYHNWVRPQQPGANVTQETYEGSIRLAGSVVGAEVVILVTWPLTRTEKSRDDREAVHNANQMIRRVATNSRSDVNKTMVGQPMVLVLEFANFTNQLHWMNARSLGMDNPDPREVSSHIGWEVEGNTTPLAETVGFGNQRIRAVCAEALDETKKCTRNIISFDDVHWCTETIGARFAAGVACLAGCALNDCNTADGQTGTGKRSVASIGSCERECNEQFMSLIPIDHDLIEMNISIHPCSAS